MSYGDTWTNNSNAYGSSVMGVCCSADGQKLAIVATNPTTQAGSLQISTDGGLGWSIGGGALFTGYGVCCSDDFSRIYIAGSNSISRSLDGGASVHTVLTLGSSITHICCSSDGMIVYATSTGGTTGQMFRKSSDGGNTWSFIDLSHTGAHYRLACSANGQYVLTGLQVAPYAIRSNDYGATWQNVTLPSSSGHFAMSADGQHQYIGHPVSGYTYLMSSHDYGVTWSDQHIGGSTAGCVVCSADGRYLIVSGGTHQTNQLFASVDFGVSFYPVNSGLALAVTAMTMSDSGQKIVSITTNATVGASICNTSLLSILGIEPASGPIAGGTPVTITGTGFESGAIATLGGTALVNQTVVDSYTITGTTAAHAAGAVDLVVTNP